MVFLLVFLSKFCTKISGQMSLRADSLRKIQQYVPAIRPIYLLTGSALFTCSLDPPYLPAHWIHPIYLLTGSALFTLSLIHI